MKLSCALVSAAARYREARAQMSVVGHKHGLGLATPDASVLPLIPIGADQFVVRVPQQARFIAAGRDVASRELGQPGSMATLQKAR